MNELRDFLAADGNLSCAILTGIVCGIAALLVVATVIFGGGL